LNDRLVLPTALAWIAAAPRGTPDGYEKLDFARALVPALAILQTLQAFPVAGSQVAFSALALVPVGALCVSDGLVQLGLTKVRFQLVASLLFLTVAVSWLPVTWQQSRAAYASAVPLGLPGATLVRVPADQGAVLRRVTQAVRNNCDTFVSVPGLDSFYVFAQLQPPGPLPTRWMWLIGDDPHQQAVVEAANRINRMCVIENDDLINFWSQGRQIPGGPLQNYIRSSFVPAYSIDRYSVLVRRT
jgi:hypothetical protein